jgi:hypothetical protein
VGKTIPSAAISPNITPVAPGGAGPNIPGGIAPLAAALTPQPSQTPAPAPSSPLQAAPVPVPNAAPAPPITPAAAPLQPVNSAAPPATGLAADNARPLTPVLQGQSKASIAEQEGYGASLGKLPEEFDKAATTAKATNATLDQMAASSDGWRMGKWADKEEGVRESLQAVAKTLGVNTPELDQKIAGFQDVSKLGGQIVRQAAHELGGRPGVQELQLLSKYLPGPELSEGGFKIIAPQLKGMNDMAIAKQDAAASWKVANGTLGPDKSGKDFQATWNAKASPAAFVLQRMRDENPAALQNMISSMSKTAEGKAALKAMQAQWNTANDNGWLKK